MGVALNSIGITYHNKGDLDKTLFFHTQNLELQKEIGNKLKQTSSIHNIGNIYRDKGEYDIALDYYSQCLDIYEEFDANKHYFIHTFANIGDIHCQKGDYEKAKEFLEKSYGILKEVGLIQGDLLCYVTAQLFLVYKYLGLSYDKDEINILINKTDFIFYGLTYIIYQLLENTSYLETSYNQVQVMADNLKPNVAAKFLSYPIPKAIVEEWEKVK